MLVLKTGIEKLREAVEAQTALLEWRGQRLSERAAVNLRGFNEDAALKGDMTQRAVRSDTAAEQLLASGRAPAM